MLIPPFNLIRIEFKYIWLAYILPILITFYQNHSEIIFNFDLTASRINFYSLLSSIYRLNSVALFKKNYLERLLYDDESRGICENTIRSTNPAWRKADVSCHFPFCARYTISPTCFWAPSDKRDTCKLALLTSVGRKGQMSGAVLKTSLEGATLFEARRGSVRRNKRDPTVRDFVRPLCY